MDDWEETYDKLWRATQPHFTRHFNKEWRKLECKNPQKKYESSDVFCEAPLPHTLEAPQGGEKSTTADDSFTAAMEYAAVLENKSNT